MEIRQLTAADLWQLSEIAEKISADLIDTFAGKEMKEQQAGIHIVLAALRYFPNEIKSFLAHVTDQSAEELDKKPFTEPIKILRALWKKQEIKDFLQEMRSFYADIFAKQ